MYLDGRIPFIGVTPVSLSRIRKRLASQKK